MNSIQDPTETLIDLLLRIRRGEIVDKVATKELREHVLSVGSSTPDNLNCVSHIEVGRTRPRAGPRREGGVKIRGRAVMIADVINAAEDSPIPDCVRKEFPKLKLAEWRACLRFATLLLLSLHQEEWEENK